jgi:hypothetical protein
MDKVQKLSHAKVKARSLVTHAQCCVRNFDVSNICWLETEFLQYSYSRKFKIVLLHVTDTRSLLNE